MEEEEEHEAHDEDDADMVVADMVNEVREKTKIYVSMRGTVRYT